MLASPFTPGPHPADPEAHLLVAITDFTAHHAADLPGILIAGMRLRRTWAERPGAVGVWLWTRPSERRAGSVSVWRDSAAMREFIRWPPHAEIMNRYRDRGHVRGFTWKGPFDPAETWRQAARALDGRDVWLKRGDRYVLTGNDLRESPRCDASCSPGSTHRS